MRRFASTFILSMALGGSVTAIAMAAEQPPGRYYDQDRKDYHEWNEREDRAYRHWLQMNHKAYHDWKKSNAKEQRAYWKWRHDHRGDDWR